MRHQRTWHRIIVLAAVATLVLTGCGGDGGSPQADGSAATADDGNTQQEGEPVTVKFWTHTHPPMVELNEELIAEYEAEHPNVTIDYQVVPNNEFGTKLLTAVSSGTGPDIINMDDSALRGEYIPRDLVAPLDPEALGYDSEDDLLSAYEPGVLDGAADGDGTLYGIPSEFNTTGFAINTMAFEEAGLSEADYPATWDDVAAIADSLNSDDRQAFNFLYLHEGWYMQQYQTLLRQTAGRIISEDGTQSVINEDGAVEALQIWYDLIVEEEVGNPDTSSREATQPFDDYATGRMAMSVMYPWGVGQIRDTSPEVFEGTQITNVPQVNPSDPVTRWYGYYWALTSYSEVKPEASKFVAFLASHPDRWLTDVDFVQPVAGWIDSEAAQNIPFADGWATAYETGDFDEVAPGYSEIKFAVKRAIERSIFDGDDPQESLDVADEEIQDIIDS